MTDDIIWPKLLVRGIANKNLNILFGAGIGFEFGFPLWDDLIKGIFEDIRHKLNDDDIQEFNAFLDVKDYLEAMEFLIYKSSEEVIDCMERSFQSEEFSQDQIENSNLYLLLKLGAHSYLTTNVDDSFEQVKSYSGHRTATIFPYTSEEDIKDKVIFHDSKSNPLIIRLHGELSQKSSLVFSKSQYHQLMLDNPYIYHQILPALFLTSATLIVGYSLSDPDLQLLLQNMNSVEGTRKNIFLLNTSNSLSDFKKRNLETRYGINVIDLTKFNSGILEDEGNYETKLLKFYLKQLVNVKDKCEQLDINELKELLNKSDKAINDQLFDKERYLNGT